jgi:beta-ketodecanoyl-[acyl-carrier-protein] synthase
MTKIAISGTGLYTPPNSISNEELVQSYNAYVEQHNRAHAAEIAAGTMPALQASSVEFVVKASGIKARYVIDKAGVLDPARMCPNIPERPNDQISVLAEIGVTAAKQALANAGLEAKDIDCVLVAASNMQRAYPAMAVEVQHYLGTSGFGFDMNVACSSATFGIQAAADMIRAGSVKRALVVNPEICSGHLNWRDRDSHFIFGDVATALVLERADEATSANKWEILGTRLKTQFSNNIRNNFGFLNRAAPDGVGKPDKLFVQEGRKVFKDVVPMVSEMIVDHLQDMQIPGTALKRMWLHQANINKNDFIARRVLGRDPVGFESPTILDEYANTSSAGSIIAFHKYSSDLAKGDLGVICSFGAGYSAGTVIVQKAA